MTRISSLGFAFALAFASTLAPRPAFAQPDDEDIDIFGLEGDDDAPSEGDSPADDAPPPSEDAPPSPPSEDAPASPPDDAPARHAEGEGGEGPAPSEDAPGDAPSEGDTPGDDAPDASDDGTADDDEEIDIFGLGSEGRDGEDGEDGRDGGDGEESGAPTERGYAFDAAETPDAPDPDEADDERHAETDPLVIEYTVEDVFDGSGPDEVVSEEELDALEIDDPTQILLRLPSVYVRSEEGFGLRPNIGIRGTNSDRSARITLMEDGILLGPAPYSAPAAYYFPLATRMTSFAVFKGPGAILFGPSTVGGAIDMTTRRVPDETSAEVDLAFGSFVSRRAHAWGGVRADYGGLLIEVADIGTRGFQDIDFVDVDTGFQRTDLMLRGELHTDLLGDVFHRVDIKLGYGRERSRSSYLGLSDEDLEDDPYRRYLASANDNMRWRRYQAEIRYDLAVGDSFKLETSAYLHRFERVFTRFNRFADGTDAVNVLRDPMGLANQSYFQVLTGATDTPAGASGIRAPETLMVVANDRDYWVYGTQTRARYEREGENAEHTLEAGLRVHYDEINRDHRESGYLVRSERLVPDGFDALPVADNQGQAIAIAAHARYSVSVGDFRIQPGVRLEVIRTSLDNRLTGTSASGTQIAPLWGVGGQYAVTEELGVFVGVHSGFSPVSPGNEDAADPEETIAYEAGIRFQGEDTLGDGHGVFVELNGYFNDYRNLLLQCAGASGCPPENIGLQFNAGEANVGGIELVVSGDIPLTDDWALPMRLTYGLTHATFRELAPSIGTPGYQHAEDGDRLPFIPRHQASLQIGARHERFDANLVTRYVGSMSEGRLAPGGATLFTDDYVQMDLAAGYQVFEPLRIYVRGENLLNQTPIVSRRPFGARTIKPLSAIVGLELEY